MPRIASARLAAGALKSPIRLFQAVTVVPPEKTIPLRAGEVVEIAPVSEILQTSLSNTFTVVLLVTETPLARGEVVPEPESPVIRLYGPMFWVVPPVIEMPVTIEETPVEESPVTVLFEKFWFPEVDKMPVTSPAPATLLMVLPEQLLFANVLSLKPTWRICAELVPATMLLNVLFVTVFLEPGVVPSPLLQPVIVVAPVKVRFEKLLPVFVSVTVFPDEPNEL